MDNEEVKILLKGIKEMNRIDGIHRVFIVLTVIWTCFLTLLGRGGFQDELWGQGGSMFFIVWSIPVGFMYSIVWVINGFRKK